MSMLTQHLGLKIFLLLAVVGHAGFVQALLGREPPWMQVGFTVIFAPIVLVLVGEWIAADAESTKGRRLGFGLAAVGASGHLLLDLCCLSLPYLHVPDWKWGLGGVACGALVMGLALRHAVRGLRTPDAPAPDLSEPLPMSASRLARLARAAAQVGGTWIAVLCVSLGFVGMGIWGLFRRQKLEGGLLFAIAFFALCALVAVWAGLDRRALFLGQPSLWSRLARSRRSTARLTQQGLALLQRRGGVPCATLYPWDALAGLAMGEYMHQPAIFVELSSVDAPKYVTGEGVSDPPPPGWWAEQQRTMRWTTALCDAPVVLFGPLCPEGPGPLFRSLRAHLGDPASRETLPDVVAVLRSVV